MFLLLVISSCGNYKRFTYLQVPQSGTSDSLYQAKTSYYKLQPADVLHVKVLSLDENITKMFNSDATLSNPSLTGNTAGSMYLTGYSIDKEGYITLPILGKISLVGLTIEEAKQKIQEITNSYLTDARIDLKLVSFRISLLGEVKSPGQYNIFNDKANILEAISMAGDITYNGSRKNLLIVRNTTNGTKTIKVDLTQRSLLSSDQYYLQPNDIIYIEPLKSTAFRIRVSDYSVLLTLITSTITAALLVTQALNK